MRIGGRIFRRVLFAHLGRLLSNGYVRLPLDKYRHSIFVRPHMIYTSQVKGVYWNVWGFWRLYSVGGRILDYLCPVLLACTRYWWWLRSGWSLLNALKVTSIDDSGNCASKEVYLIC